MMTEPDSRHDRPGLPQPAARWAARREEDLTFNHALLDAREARSHLGGINLAAIAEKAAASRGRLEVAPVTITALIREIERLTINDAHRTELLERLAFEETRRYDLDLRYPLAQLDDDCFIAWSGGGDGPVGWTMTEVEARTRGWTAEHVARAKERGPEGAKFNRAGPGEQNLTIEAIKEAYASPEAYKAFRLTPDKVHPCTTADVTQNEAGTWVEGPVYWVPWEPDKAPETLPEKWSDRF